MRVTYEGEAYRTVSGQNSNKSPSASRMNFPAHRLYNDEDWELITRHAMDARIMENVSRPGRSLESDRLRRSMPPPAPTPAPNMIRPSTNGTPGPAGGFIRASNPLQRIYVPRQYCPHSCLRQPPSIDFIMNTAMYLMSKVLNTAAGCGPRFWKYPCWMAQFLQGGRPFVL